MSSDEEDEGSPIRRFRILTKKGRSEELTELLRLLDALCRHRRDQYESMGAQVHLRFLSKKVSSHAFLIKRLPRNAYESTWLEGLPNIQREELEVVQKEYDFSVNGEL